MARSSVGEEKQGLFWKPLLVWDQVMAHLTEKVKRKLKEQKTTQSSGHTWRLDWHVAAASGCEPKQAIHDKDEKPVDTVDGGRQS